MPLVGCYDQCAGRHAEIALASLVEHLQAVHAHTQQAGKKAQVAVLQAFPDFDVQRRDEVLNCLRRRYQSQ
jgi:hypothetical protein